MNFSRIQKLGFQYSVVYGYSEGVQNGYYWALTQVQNYCGQGGCGMVNECVDASGGKNCVDGCAPFCTECVGECGGACSSNCSGGCKGNCNVGCTGGAVDTIAANLYLHEFIEAANVQDIITLVSYELQRRGLSPTTDNLTAKATLTTAAIFQHIRTNLQKIDLGQGWQKLRDGHWVYVWEGGQVVVNNWVFWENGYYYLGDDGYMLSNTTETINGKTYHFNSSGLKDSGPDPTPLNIYTGFGDDSYNHIIYRSTVQHLIDCGLDAYSSPIMTS